MMKIGIIGAGAIGSYFAMKLKIVGFSPILFTNQKEDSLNIIYRDKDRFYTKHFKSGDYLMQNEFDFLFITVKSYSLENVINKYRVLLNSSKRIILVQSNINLAHYDWGDNISKLYLAPVMIGVIGDYRSIVYETNEGHILLGKLNNEMSDDTLLIRNLLMNISDVVLSENIQFDLFLKIIINTALFPLSILNACSFGKAHTEIENIEFANSVFYECIQVAKAHFKEHNISLKKIRIESISKNDTLRFIKEKLKKYPMVFPSVLIDILKEKEENELKFFYDDIILLSKKYKIEAKNILLSISILNCFCKKKKFFDIQTINEIMKNYCQ